MVFYATHARKKPGGPQVISRKEEKGIGLLGNWEAFLLDKRDKIVYSSDECGSGGMADTPDLKSVGEQSS